MFSADKHGNRAVCLADYGRLKKGAIVPASNELYADVEAWIAEGNTLAAFDGYPDLPITEGQLQSWRESAVVSRFQARAALLSAELLDDVETLMQAPTTSAIERLAWQDAQEFRRDSPTIASMTQALGLSDADVDQLFIDAAQIVA